MAAHLAVTKITEMRVCSRNEMPNGAPRIAPTESDPTWRCRLKKVNLAQKFSLFSDHYSPKIVGEINDSFVKLVKLKGDFMWHHHDVEDELFLVVSGRLRMKIREDGIEREEVIRAGEFIIIPHGVEHLPSADDETHVMLLEPKSTLNTGNVENERTVADLEHI